ncbi:hypothetical protein Fmac_018415 [Flemingia macrophylla]|uniref:Uncharacterized protein n=1 Tax=Flemingia macrophylla TaxID=520843 RepID=A0ABD1M4X3_9FABA
MNALIPKKMLSVQGRHKRPKDVGPQMMKTRDEVNNETCDVVHCYYGIRLHPLMCSDCFSVTPTAPGLGRCSKCLHNLYSKPRTKLGVYSCPLYSFHRLMAVPPKCR